MSNTAQVRINNIRSSKGRNVPKITSIKASLLKDYLESLIREANGVFTPNRAKEFDYLPLLSVRDLADTGEEIIFKTWDDLPKETVVNSKGVPILIIIPEGSEASMGVNQTEGLKDMERKALSKAMLKNPNSTEPDFVVPDLPKKKK